MPKTLILALFLTLILAPGAQILASEGAQEPNTTNYLPGKGNVQNFIKSAPLKIYEYFRGFLPSLSQGGWSGRWQDAKETIQGAWQTISLGSWTQNTITNVKNGILDSPGKIKKVFGF